MPKPVETNDVSIDVAGLVIEETQLKYTFALDSYDGLARVLVEDVSGRSAVVLVDDSSPKQEWTRWIGFSAPLPLSRDSVPWMWEKGDTTKVFRFTIWSKQKKDPIVAYQPAVYAGRTKKGIHELVRKMKKSEPGATDNPDDAQ